MSLFLPGAASLRTERTSQLMFHYRAADATIHALSGQLGLFTLFITGGYTPGNITGQNNVAVSAGHGLPRFDQAPARGGITRLITQGEPVGQDSENVYYEFPAKVQPLTMLWRLLSFYTVGQVITPVRYGPYIGYDTTLGGRLAVRRSGADWHAVRTKGATEILSVVSDVGLIYPVDVLLTFSELGALTLSVRDAAGIHVGTTATDVSLANPADSWSAHPAGTRLALCGMQGLVAPGGDWYHEELKVSRGVKTFADMDELS